ncbi:hypothetical protein MBLNU230_g3850t1 [Neophaeotheca triangularis]
MARTAHLLAVTGSVLVLISLLPLAYLLGFEILLQWHGKDGINYEETVHINSPIENDKLGAIASNDASSYLVGVGKADITGPVVEVNFMGYADPAQLGSGVRQRLYSRAFVVASSEKPKDRWVYLVLDTQSGDTAVRHGILEALSNMGGEYAVYGQQNVAVTGTHSHSGPGAWLNYLLPQITSRGFSKQSYRAIVDGAVASIKQAHQGLAPGELSVGSIDILDANINRSPYAYLANPEEERQRYKHNVDKTLTMLRFAHRHKGGSKDIGILTWFPVHGTSMLGNNTLVTGDNKGVAAKLFESSQMNNPSFIAGFSQANVGDTSPNVLGAYCEYGPHAGETCDFKTSLCGNKTQPCHGRGPYYGRDDVGTASAFEIGRRQFDAAHELFLNDTAFTSLWDSTVKSVHRFADFSNLNFTLANGTLAHTCPAALGYSFAAGTTDGPGAFDFKQAQPGDPHANPLWSLVGNRIATPNDTQRACHGDKAILLDVGESDSPYAWSPNIVDVQTLRVGPLFIIISPGEATTMSGRRWREALHDAAVVTLPEFSSTQNRGSSQTPIVLLGGPANTYAHYIATSHEYGIQRYEGASTLYGPHTLAAHINQSLSLLPYLSTHPPDLPPHSHQPFPPIQTNTSYSFLPPIAFDRPPIFKSFGQVKQDVRPSYQVGETIEAVFVAANPRNNLRLGATYAAVEFFDPVVKVWKTIRDDGDWSLVFEWTRTSTVVGTSEVRVAWEVGWETGGWRDGTPGLKVGGEGRGEGKTDLRAGKRQEPDLKGLYRLRYFGDAKGIGGGLTGFEGVSGEFRIL